MAPDTDEYEAGLTVIGETDTVESFCRYFNWLKPPSKLERNSNYHLFKSGIARLEEVRGADGALANAYVRVDRAKVLREGRAAAGRLLVELQVRKSTADGAGAREFYTALTEPFPGWDGELRDLVLRKKLVRLSAPAPAPALILSSAVGC